MSKYDSLSVPEIIVRIADSTDRKMAWLFFVFFSRFEYALKKDKRYLEKGSGDARPNWDRFASDNDQKFNQVNDQHLAAAVSYIKASPPRKQVRKDGKLDWSDPLVHDGKTPTLIWLLLCIRTVRNNLFHGGKFPHFPIHDPSRDRDLISNSLLILGHSLRLDGDIERAFSEDIDL